MGQLAFPGEEIAQGEMAVPVEIFEEDTLDFLVVPGHAEAGFTDVGVYTGVDALADLARTVVEGVGGLGESAREIARLGSG